MRNTNANPCPGETSLHLFEWFQDLADVVAAIKTYRSVKVLTSPACGNVVVTDEPKCAKCSGMVSAFVTQIPTMTVRVLHGEPQSTLGLD